MQTQRWLMVALILAATACGGDDTRAATMNGAEPFWGDDPTAEEIERSRLENDWEQVVQLAPVPPGETPPNPETWEGITAAAVNDSPSFLPLYGDVAGPSVFRVQILLDRALFSPGMIDGRWGRNTAKAVYWLQQREGLPATGRVDSVTFARLGDLAGSPQQLVRQHTLTAEDVEGPFVEIPSDIYEQEKLDCLCYESLTEKLSELFHVSPELLAKLNPGVELNSLRAGQAIHVPNVRSPEARAPGQVAQLIVSDRGRYLHAVDAQGRVLYHFPSTLGSSYDPSPTGEYEVTKITEDPWWHYQPSILEHVDSSEPEANIPPGPNNAVGRIWMALSKPHYGIHGTKSPETIGYATSAGCVRLTNWDALFLGRRIAEGVPVRFRDTRGEAAGGTAAGGETQAGAE